GGPPPNSSIGARWGLGGAARAAWGRSEGGGGGGPARGPQMSLVRGLLLDLQRLEPAEPILERGLRGQPAAARRAVDLGRRAQRLRQRTPRRFVAHVAQDLDRFQIGGDLLVARERANDQRVDDEVEQPGAGDGDAEHGEAG